MHIAVQSATPVPSEPEVSRNPRSCKACGSSQLTIEYGKFGYYFKCKACEANTALKIGCEVPGHKEKIRKSKLTFYRECEHCVSSTIFYVNEAKEQT